MAKGRIEDDIDALFALSLTEFTSARNALAARLKQGGSGEEADRAKALVKPSASAWAVNQLYWKHRKEFDRLIETGHRVRQAQTAQFAGKASNIRESLDVRRQSISVLLHLAAKLLRDEGHNPTPDILRRIGAAIEALSAYAALPETVRLGRLTTDIDPPGFESLTTSIPGVALTNRPKASTTTNSNKVEETGRERIAAAKVSLRNAKRALTDARARAKNAEAVFKGANAVATKAEKHRREAEERFKKAITAAQEATARMPGLASDADAATKAAEDAERAVEKASRRLRLERP